MSSQGQKNKDDDDSRRPTFTLREPTRTLDEVLMEESVRKRIDRALAIVRNRDLIFEKWGFKKIDRSSKSIVILYGPPGTGKTMTAEAMGHALGRKIVCGSYAEIESMYVGEGAKNLKAIFNFAAENDAVLFFDEADSFLSQRIKNTEHGSDKHYNRMSNELFQLLENFNGLVIFATNLLSDVDEAFKSRIIDSILFDLPTEDMRKRMIKNMIPDEFPMANPLSDEELTRLAVEIDGFSGRDMRKSALLSLSEASIKYCEGEKTEFDFDDVAEGFREVKAYKEAIENENQILSVEDSQSLLDEQTRVEKTIQAVRHAMWLDGAPNEATINVAREIARSLPGMKVDSENPMKASLTLSEICGAELSSTIKKSIIDNIITILTFSGNVSEKSNHFINDVISLLGYDETARKEINDYVSHRAVAAGAIKDFKY